jgi:hypothetical protein
MKTPIYIIEQRGDYAVDGTTLIAAFKSIKEAEEYIKEKFSDFKIDESDSTNSISWVRAEPENHWTDYTYLNIIELDLINKEENK